MSTVLMQKRGTCPAPPPPPPPPPRFDERTARAIKVACQGPAFPPDVIETLRGLLAPNARRKP